MSNNRLTRLLLAALLLVSLLCVGCGKQTTDPAPQTPPADSSGTAAQNDEQPADGETTPEEEAPGQTPADKSSAEGKDAAADLATFAYDEVADVFYYTEATLTDTFGKPLDISRDSEAGLETIEYEYSDMSFKMAAFDSESAPSVFEAELECDKVAAPRGIAIGDTIEEVTAKFPQTSDETINEGDDVYHMLYGTFEYMGTFGSIEYDSNGKADKFMFAHEGVGMEIELSNDKVSGYRYFVSTN